MPRKTYEPRLANLTRKFKCFVCGKEVETTVPYERWGYTVVSKMELPVCSYKCMRSYNGVNRFTKWDEQRQKRFMKAFLYNEARQAGWSKEKSLAYAGVESYGSMGIILQECADDCRYGEFVQKLLEQGLMDDGIQAERPSDGSTDTDFVDAPCRD